MSLEVLHRTPPAVTQKLPLLFVHGAWHGAWCWDVHFMPYFVQQGYRCYALSLRGHGGSDGHARIRWHSIADYVDDVAQTAAAIQLETGRRPVIIGHSMGGFVAQKFLERHTASGAALLASIPVHGFLPSLLRTAARKPAAAFRVYARLSPYELVRTPQLMRHFFFSPDIPRAQIHAYHTRLQQESMRMSFDVSLLNLPRPQDIINVPPVLVLAAGNDTLFTVDEQRTTARAYNAKLVVIDNMAHDVMLENNWQDAAVALLDWLGTLES